ncbi:hypothetical protein T05_10224 [Trichinella murrelli]|uniref:Uncharacterized protein n=1 Tax=Trichinella murrelli TaxID=144512 RepID=A0A0V0U2F9_9BILA|nr:hypothetical protein T05_10224 [Trichinella murrelli]
MAALTFGHLVFMTSADKNNEEKKKYERGRHEAERRQYEVEQKKTASRCMRLAVGPNSVSLGGG